MRESIKILEECTNALVDAGFVRMRRGSVCFEIDTNFIGGVSLQPIKHINFVNINCFGALY